MLCFAWLPSTASVLLMVYMAHEASADAAQAFRKASGGNYLVPSKSTLRSRAPRLYQTSHDVRAPCHAHHDFGMAHKRPLVPSGLEVGHHQRHVR